MGAPPHARDFPAAGRGASVRRGLDRPHPREKPKAVRAGAPQVVDPARRSARRTRAGPRPRPQANLWPQRMPLGRGFPCRRSPARTVADPNNAAPDRGTWYVTAVGVATMETAPARPRCGYKRSPRGCPLSVSASVGHVDLPTRREAERRSPVLAGLRRAGRYWARTSDPSLSTRSRRSRPFAHVRSTGMVPPFSTPRANDERT